MGSSEGIRVVIAHGSGRYASALSSALGELRGVEVVAMVSSVNAASTAAGLLKADVVLVGETLGVGGPLQAVRELERSGCDARVLAVCPHLAPDVCRLRLSGGVVGVVSEDARLPAWRDALRPLGRDGSSHVAPR